MPAPGGHETTPAASVPREGQLPVPGATLFYRVHGTGPLLVLLQGGAGDADGTVGVVRQLLDRFTVVTYDRRGLVRSPLDDPTVVPDIRTHADDVHRLLAAVTSEPAFVAGFSFGALVGLDLLARYSGQVRRLLAHEAPTPQVLPEPARTHMQQRQREVEITFAREGPLAAMQAFAALAGLDFDDVEPGLELPRPTPQYAVNVGFFLAHDAPAARAYQVDLAALRRVATQMIVAAGSANRDQPVHRCAAALAEAMGTPLVEFPGGHNGFVTHPRAFAARLQDVFGNGEGR